MAKARGFNRALQYYHSKAPVPGFFSTLDELIAVSPQESMAVQQWKEYLKPGKMLEREGVQYPLKKAELQDAEFDGLLAMLARERPDGKVSRQDIFMALDESRPEFIGETRDSLEDMLGYREENMLEIEGELRELGHIGPSVTAEGAAPLRTHLQDPKYEKWGFHHKSTDELEQSGYFESVTRFKGNMDKVLQHYSEDTLSWSRATRHEFTDQIGEGTGETIRLVEEIQSDYHQKGRQRGYAGDEALDRQLGLDDEISEMKADFERHTGLKYNELTTEQLEGLDGPSNDRLIQIEQKSEEFDSIDQMMEPIPFRDTKDYARHELNKQLIDAVENNEDFLALVRGEDQVHRYSQHMTTKQQEGMRNAYDKLYPSVMKSLANRYGGKMTEVQITTLEKPNTRVAGLVDFGLENVDDLYQTSREFLAGEDADDWRMAVDSFNEVIASYAHHLDNTRPENLEAIRKARRQFKMLKMEVQDIIEPDIDDLVQSGYVREDITDETIEGLSELRMSTGSSSYEEAQSSLAQLAHMVEDLERKYAVQVGTTPIRALKRFPAIEFTPELRKKVKQGGVPLYAGGGTVKRALPDLKFGPRIHESAMEAAKRGDIKHSLALLKQLQELLQMNDEEFSKMLGQGFGGERGFAEGGGLYRALAKGGKIIDATKRFGKKAEPEEIVDRYDPANIKVTSREHLPPTPEFQEWLDDFERKLEARRVEKDRILSETVLEHDRGDIVMGEKFRHEVLFSDVDRKGNVYYRVRNLDKGGEYDLPAHAIQSKFKGPKAATTSPVSTDEYNKIQTILKEEMEGNFDDIEIYPDPRRPGMYAVREAGREPFSEELGGGFEGFMIDFNVEDVPMDGIEGVTFKDWPPKSRYAEGGSAKKDRPALDLLRATGRSLAGAIPFAGEEAQLIGEDVGEQIYRKGAIPVAGFKTQWWGINPTTGELEYAGPLAGGPGLSSVPDEMWQYDPQGALEMAQYLEAQRDEETTGAIPGIVDETMAIPLFAELATAGAIPSPAISQEAGTRIMNTEEAVLEDLGIDQPRGLLENTLYSAGIMAGQLPVPATWLGRGRQAVEGGKGLLQKLARAPGVTGRAGVEFISPIIDPKVANYVAGSIFGGGLMTGIQTAVDIMAPEETPPEIEELVERAKAGDQEAYQMLQELYTEYKTQVGMQEYGQDETVQEALQRLDSGMMFAKGGGVSRRDFLKGLGATAAGAGAVGKAGVRSTDPAVALKEIEAAIEVPAAAAKSIPNLKLQTIIGKLTRIIREEGEMNWGEKSGDFDPDMIEMHESDAKQYEKVLSAIEEGKFKKAARLYDDQDTAARDAIYDHLTEEERAPLQQALGKGESFWEYAELENHPDLDRISREILELQDQGKDKALRKKIKALEKDGWDSDNWESVVDESLANQGIDFEDTPGYDRTTPVKPKKRFRRLAKGGGVSRRDFLKGLGAAGAAGAAGKAGMKADPEAALKQIEAGIEAPTFKGVAHGLPEATKKLMDQKFPQWLRDVLSDAEDELGGNPNLDAESVEIFEGRIDEINAVGDWKDPDLTEWGAGELEELTENLLDNAEWKGDVETTEILRPLAEKMNMKVPEVKPWTARDKLWWDYARGSLSLNDYDHAVRMEKMWDTLKQERPDLEMPPNLERYIDKSRLGIIERFEKVTGGEDQFLNLAAQDDLKRLFFEGHESTAFAKEQFAKGGGVSRRDFLKGLGAVGAAGAAAGKAGMKAVDPETALKQIEAGIVTKGVPAKVDVRDLANVIRKKDFTALELDSIMDRFHDRRRDITDTLHEEPNIIEFENEIDVIDRFENLDPEEILDADLEDYLVAEAEDAASDYGLDMYDYGPDDGLEGRFNVWENLDKEFNTPRAFVESARRAAAEAVPNPHPRVELAFNEFLEDARIFEDRLEYGIDDLAGYVGDDLELAEQLQKALHAGNPHHQKFAKGGGVSRRDFLTGLGAAGTAAVAGGKGAVHSGDPAIALKEIEEALDVVPAAAKGAKVLSPKQLWNIASLFGKNEVEYGKVLKELPLEELKQYDDFVNTKFGELVQSSEFAEAAGESAGLSSDRFDYIAEGVLGQGEEAFEAAKLGALDPIEQEGIFYPVHDAQEALGYDFDWTRLDEPAAPPRVFKPMEEHPQYAELETEVKSLNDQLSKATNKGLEKEAIEIDRKLDEVAERLDREGYDYSEWDLLEMDTTIEDELDRLRGFL